MFLSTEGTVTCSLCNVDICKHCMISTSEENNICFDVTNQILVTIKCISMQKMLMEIASKGISIPVTAAMRDTIDLHQSTMERDEINMMGKDIENVKCPLLSTDKISLMEFESKVKGLVREINRVTNSEALQNKEVCDLIHLFANLVRFDDNESKKMQR